MEQLKTFELDGVEYRMTPANAGAAWNAIKNALKLVQSMDLSLLGKNGEKGEKDKKDNTQAGLDILKNVLASLGDPSVKALEDLVLKHTTANVNGAQYRLSDKFDSHFNQYRRHLLSVLKEGLIYQFADFFPVGAESLTATLNNLSAQ